LETAGGLLITVRLVCPGQRGGHGHGVLTGLIEVTNEVA
jgi:hypothetical protein